jgi:protein-disulfide isomerase
MEEKEIKDASIEEVEEKELEIEESEEVKKDKKIKNLISAVILLAGLFVGSVFIDLVQMVRGSGFSQQALNGVDVLAAAGKTWVAYNDPIVKVQIISDDTCEKCKPDEVLVGLKQALPTMQNEKIDMNSSQGKKLIAQFNIKAIPAFIFSKEVEKTELFAKAEPFLDKQGDLYAIKSAEAGFPVGKYIAAPRVSAEDITLGAKESEIKVIAFSGFTSPADKKFYQTIIVPMLKEYGDKIQVTFKNYLPPTSPVAMSASLASACANEQGKFLPYAEKLFATQDVWVKTKDANILLKSYAAGAGLNVADFGKCLDSKKYQDLINQTLTEGQSFGVAGTPSIFIGSEFETGATIKYESIKSILDKQLAK